MKQNLRTTRSGIVLFAILCIVCLSLSLVLSANYSAFAADVADETIDGLHWQIVYSNNENEYKTDLLDGSDIGDYIQNGQLVSGGAEKDYFTPSRDNVISLKLDFDSLPASVNREIYDFDNASYVGGQEINAKVNDSGEHETTVTIPVKEGQTGDPLQYSKTWKLAAVANKVNVGANDYPTGGVRAYAQTANYDLATPVYGTDIVYDFGNQTLFAIRYGSGNATHSIVTAVADGDQYFVDGSEYVYEEGVGIETGRDLVNYTFRKLDASMEEGGRQYTLKVSTLGYVDETSGLYYAAYAKTYQFGVVAQTLDADRFTYEISRTNVQYTGDDSWIPDVTVTLNGITLIAGSDYTVEASSNNVGLVSLTVKGMGLNISSVQSYTIPTKVRIEPAQNSWAQLPNIYPWSYGDYNKGINLIVGQPTFLVTDDNGVPTDVRFRIVSVDDKGNEKACEGLDDIRYEAVEEDGSYLIKEDVAVLIAKLGVGKYRLYAYVEGNTEDSTKNFLSLGENSVDFKVSIGRNSWGKIDDAANANGEISVPTIEGWVYGKLGSTDGIIKAEARFGHGTEIIIIYDKNGNMVYNSTYAGRDDVNGIGELDILKTLKAGRYTLTAEVRGTKDYTPLSTTIFFDVTPNRLPTWAVILIVAGSLAAVAIVFIVLHQKGVLQMLTGKVIVAMRTRANVDATLAAIRANKMARDAEISIAAAKAREAQEASTATEAETADTENKQ